MTKPTLKDLLIIDFNSLKDNISFENGIALLDELTNKVESGELELDQAVKSYEVGVALVQHLKLVLGEAEKKLEILQVK